MNLRDLFLAVKQWWWLPIVGTLLPVGISLYVASRQPDYYEAKATVLVGTSLQSTDPSPGAMNTSVALARAYAELVKRRPIAQGAIDRLDVPLSPSDLAIRTTTNVVPEAQLLEISVVDRDPRVAADLANALAEELISQSPGAAEGSEEQRAFILTQLDGLEEKILETKQNVRDVQGLLSTMTSAAEIQEAQQTLSALEQALATYQSTYASLLLSAGNNPNNLSVVEPAVAPATPISNRVPQIVAVAGIIGLCLSVGAILVMEYVLAGFRGESWRQPSIAGLPVLGSVPKVPKRPGLVIPRSRAVSREADALRALRTNVLLARGYKAKGTLLVTSSLPDEGKSVVAANLAADLTSRGSKVILVDANMRKPTLHKVFRLPNDRGLSDLLNSGELDLDGSLQETYDPNLFLLPAGASPPDPASLLASDTMRSLLSTLEQSDALVIFDAPAALGGPDAAILASILDAALLVVNADLASPEVLQEVRARLERAAQARLLGIVFNAVKLDGRLLPAFSTTLGELWPWPRSDEAETG